MSKTGYDLYAMLDEAQMNLQFAKGRWGQDPFNRPSGHTLANVLDNIREARATLEELEEALDPDCST